jgi:hypothetical protein
MTPHQRIIHLNKTNIHSVNLFQCDIFLVPAAIPPHAPNYRTLLTLWTGREMAALTNIRSVKECEYKTPSL